MVTALLLLVLSAQPAMTQAQPLVAASNTLTGALATAAGATRVVVLAPASLRDPTAYRLSEEELATAREADLIVYTGMEAMAAQLEDGAASGHARILQVAADYSLGALRHSILAIAEVLGTTRQANTSIGALVDFFDSWRQELRSDGVYGAPVLCHVFERGLMEELGFAVKGSFGPDPLQAGDIERLLSQWADFRVDDWSDEVSGPLRVSHPHAHLVLILRYPGPDGTSSLLDVLRADRERLKAAN